MAKRYLENKEVIKARGVEWRRSNPEARRIQNRISRHIRRSRFVGSVGRLSKDLTEKLFNLQRGKCVCCGYSLGEDYHLDHRTPIALGGVSEDWNMQLLRKSCNLNKHAKDPIDFMRSRGFLL